MHIIFVFVKALHAAQSWVSIKLVIGYFIQACTLQGPSFEKQRKLRCVWYRVGTYQQ